MTNVIYTKHPPSITHKILHNFAFLITPYSTLLKEKVCLSIVLYASVLCEWHKETKINKLMCPQSSVTSGFGPSQREANRGKAIRSISNRAVNLFEHFHRVSVFWLFPRSIKLLCSSFRYIWIFFAWLRVIEFAGRARASMILWECSVIRPSSGRNNINISVRMKGAFGDLLTLFVSFYICFIFNER